MSQRPESQLFDETSVMGGFVAVGGDPAQRQPTPASMFDACHVGVVLRAVLFVEAVVAVAAMFGASQVLDWLLRFSLLTGGVLPATLAWLIAACVLKSGLSRLASTLQWMVGITLGAAAGQIGRAHV